MSRILITTVKASFQAEALVYDSIKHLKLQQSEPSGKISDLIFTAAAAMEPLTLPNNGKLRFMCSYGGNIVPLLHKNSLFYSGGDTRIITVPATSTATISTFSAHIATALHVSNPFTLKYKLPLHDLDSLIYLSSDDDFLIFLEEFQRLLASPTPSRIRLFLFPIKQHGLLTTQSELTATQCGLTHPKTESWFVDALKSAKMMQKGVMGFGGDGQIDGQSGGLGGQESMILETTSSFGSSSSSVSLSNLPPIKACGDDNVSPLQEITTKLPPSESAASEISSLASAISHPQTGTYKDPAMDNKVSFNPFESSDAKITDTVPEAQTNKTVQVPGYPISLQLDQLQRQEVQFVPMGSHFASQNPTGILPVAACYPMYNTPPNQQQLQYLPNQPYQVHVMPVGQTHVYNSLAQYGSKDTLPVVSGRPPLHPNSTLTPTQVAYKYVPPTPPIPEFVSQVYRTTLVANTLVHVPYLENKENNVAVPHNQLQLIGITSQETANCSNEHDDDPVRAQIYKSQPPPPTLPPQYQTMTKASTE